MFESRGAAVATVVTMIVVFAANVIIAAAFDLPMLVRWALSVPLGVLTWQVIRRRFPAGPSAPTSS